MKTQQSRPRTKVPRRKTDPRMRGDHLCVCSLRSFGLLRRASPCHLRRVQLSPPTRCAPRQAFDLGESATLLWSASIRHYRRDTSSLHHAGWDPLLVMTRASSRGRRWCTHREFQASQKSQTNQQEEQGIQYYGRIPRLCQCSSTIHMA